jgi:multidrug efflux pump subunit AcrA (membrane-fusion protein)
MKSIAMIRLLTLLLVSALTVVGCEDHTGHGHEHGHSHGPGEEHEGTHEEEPPSLAITRWSEDYELFAEFTAPVAGRPVEHHAHVTRLADFQAVTEGSLEVRFKPADGPVINFVQRGVKRPGIFVFESPALAAGEYTLEMLYEHQGKVDTFDCGSLKVSDKAAAEEEEAPSAAITFLKESQWKIPFSTAWASEQLLGREMEIAATVEPAASEQLTVGAPTGGRFFHNPKLALAEGLRIEKGDVLGTIAPTVAGDDYSRLQFAVEEARLSRDQLQREIERVKPLVEQNLLPERRLLELQNDIETQTARLSSASGRLGRVDASGGAGGLVIKSTLAGIVSQVLVPNGEPVDAGAPLVRIGGTDHLWIRARFVAKPSNLFVEPKPATARLPSGEMIDLGSLGARFLSTLPAVDTQSRIATWIVDVPPRPADPDAEGADAVVEGASRDSELRPGSSVVLTVRFGKPEPLLAVPRGAVVEINTRQYVFTQHDGEHFEKRAVAVGRSDGPWVQLLSGVSKGERVVTRGGYDIHLAALMGTVESHRH